MSRHLLLVLVLIVFTVAVAFMGLAVWGTSSKIGRLESEIRFAIFGVNMTAHRVGDSWRDVGDIRVSMPCVTFIPADHGRSPDSVRVVVSYVVLPSQQAAGTDRHFVVRLFDVSRKVYAERTVATKLQSSGETVMGVVFDLPAELVSRILGATIDAVDR